MSTDGRKKGLEREKILKPEKGLAEERDWKLVKFFTNFILGLFCMSSGELMVYSGVLTV